METMESMYVREISFVTDKVNKMEIEIENEMNDIERLREQLKQKQKMVEGLKGILN